MIELEKGGDIWEVSPHATGYTGVSVYRDLAPLEFGSWEHLSDFSDKYGYTVHYRQTQNT